MGKPQEKPREEEHRKIGEGSLTAWARMGHKELTAALKAFPDRMPLIEEPGMPSVPTSYEVSKQRGAVQSKGTVHGKSNDREIEPELEP